MIDQYVHNTLLTYKHKSFTQHLLVQHAGEDLIYRVETSDRTIIFHVGQILVWVPFLVLVYSLLRRK